MKDTLARLGGAAVVAMALLATSASAATVRVTVDGKLWDVGTVKGTFIGLNAQLTSQPWWPGESLARSFAAAVGLQLGTPNGNSTPLGPYFAFFEPGGERDLVKAMTAYANTLVDPPVTELLETRVQTRNEAVWAVATPAPVPVPAAGLMLLTGLAAAALPALRRRRA